MYIKLNLHHGIKQKELHILYATLDYEGTDRVLTDSTYTCAIAP